MWEPSSVQIKARRGPLKARDLDSRHFGEDIPVSEYADSGIRGEFAEALAFGRRWDDRAGLP